MNIRQFAIAVLDDENGINEAAYNQLADALTAEGHNDILNAVSAQDGRYYLGEDDAEELRNPPVTVPQENYRPVETPLGEQIDGGGEID